jgi:hypothetical protein
MVLRLTPDVRALGALSNSVKVVLEAELCDEPITLDQGSLLTPEMTRGRLGGIWSSMNVQYNAADWAEIIPFPYKTCFLIPYKFLTDEVFGPVST